jgi:hypothetical protein
MLRPPNRRCARIAGGNFVRENSVKFIAKGGAAAVDNALLVHTADAIGGALCEGNAAGAKSTGGNMY